jgi:hypothetical protein
MYVSSTALREYKVICSYLVEPYVNKGLYVRI